MFTGGPGSRKGCIVDDLIMAYHLKHICTEQLLHSELPKKLAGVAKIENVNGVKEVLEVRLTLMCVMNCCLKEKSIIDTENTSIKAQLIVII